MIIHWNNRIIIQALFEVPDPTTGAMVPTTPTTAKFLVTDPTGLLTVINWGDPNTSNPSPGVLECVLLPPFLITGSRRYFVEWLGFGAAQGGGEDFFLIASTGLPQVSP